MKAKHRETGEIFDLAEEGIIARDGRHFCWHQVDLLPEPIDEKPSAVERVMENMKELGKAINSMGAKASGLTNMSYEYCSVREPHTPIGYLELEETMTRIPVFKRIGWFRHLMLKLCFGLKYIQEN